MGKTSLLLGFLAAAAAIAACSSEPDGDTNDGGTGPGVVGSEDASSADSGAPGHVGDDAGDSRDGASDADADADAPELRTLAISPASPVLVVKDNTGVVQPFTLTGTFSDGHTEDLTAQSTFGIDDMRLGTFAGPSFTSTTTIGGSSFVRARIGTMSVSTAITVQLQQNVLDSPPAGSGQSALPASPETKFGGAVDGTYKPKIVYPNDGVMLPPNMGPTEIHFLPENAGTTLFELAFSNTVVDVHVYLRCYLPAGVALPVGQRGCIYTPGEQVWQSLAQSNRGGQPLTLTVRATDDSGAATVAVSAPISLEFAKTDVKGALYWFQTAGTTGVARYDFANTTSSAASIAMRASNVSTSVSCVGCHAVRPDGKVMAVEVNGQNDGRLALVDLAGFASTDKAPLVQGGAKLSNFESWNPDGTKFVGVYADSAATTYNLRLFNGDTGAPEGEIANTGTKTNPANHPDWSTDGKTIAYQSMGIAGTNQRSYKGSINVVTANGTGWNAPMTVVPAVSGKNRYYPAIAPDNAFLLFDESTCPQGSEAHTNCNGDSDASAHIWAALLGANATPVDLVKANRPGPMDTTADITNSYPRWNPFVGVGNRGETSRIMWVTFGSTRSYGLRAAPASGGPENPMFSQLWMAAVDPDQMKAGGDPSFAAFALPFQPVQDSSNHAPQWAKYFVSNTCSPLAEGCGAGGSACCNGLQCVQPGTTPLAACNGAADCTCQDVPQCAPAFEKCSSAAPCCNGLRCLDDATGSDCKGGACTCKPPCSGSGQTCGGSQACCDGLTCKTTTSGSSCQ